MLDYTITNGCLDSWIDVYIGGFKTFNIIGDIMDEICFFF